MVDKSELVLTRRAGVMVLAVIVITLGFMAVLPDIQIEMDFKKYMPENEAVEAFDEMAEFFGPENKYHYILVEDSRTSNNILTPASLREQFNVSEEVAKNDGVIDVYGLAVMIDTLTNEILNQSISEISDATINMILDTFQALAQGKINITGYSSTEFQTLEDLLLSKDFDPEAEELSAEYTVILVVMDPALETSELKEVSKDIKENLVIQEFSELKLGHTGNYLVTSDIDRIGNENVLILGLSIVILITFVLAFTFRRVSYVVLPMATLAITIVWTLGTMTLLGLKFTLVEIAVIPLILGLGVDYTVHTSRRYLSELPKTDTPLKAMSRVQRRIVPAIFLAVLTTTIAFMSNLLSPIQPIRDFGIICAIGIFYAFVLTLIFHNTCRVLIDRTARRSEAGRTSAPEETRMVKLAITTASRSVNWFPVLAITMVAVISSLAFVGAVNVRTEFSETDFLPDDWESISVSRTINDQFEAGRYSEVYIYIRDELEIPQNIATVEMLRQLEDFINDLGNNEYVVKIGGIPRAESVMYYTQKILADDQTLSSMYDQDGDGMPDDSGAVLDIFDFLIDYDVLADPLTGQTYSERMRALLHQNEDGNYDATRIIIFVRAETTSEIEDLYEQLQDTVPDFIDTSVVITGNVIMTIITIDALQTGQINSTILAIILAFVLLVILYRSVGLGLISLVPVVLSTLWILGTMYFFGISLNVLTVMVTALTIGLGLDYAIYIVTRYQEERRTKSINDAINSTIKGTGSALFISGVTTVCGFAVLMLSPIPIIAHFGLIIATTIIYCGVLAVVVLPILLGSWEKFRKNQEE
jgi:predicted RND superfamily exporter protein